MLRKLGSLALAMLLAVGSAALNTGCGTVLGHAEPQPIDVRLNPDDKATVFLDGIKIGEGSGTYPVDPKAEAHTFKVRTADGREGNGTTTREVMTGVVIADAFMLIFPIFIDYYNGGLYKWKNPIPINLGKAPEVEPQPTDTIRPLPNGTNTSNQVEMRTCPNCGEQRPVNSDVCPHCGLK